MSQVVLSHDLPAHGLDKATQSADDCHVSKGTGVPQIEGPPDDPVALRAPLARLVLDEVRLYQPTLWRTSTS